MPVVGYENLYEVSSYGNVRRKMKDGRVRPLKLVICKTGYLVVTLCNKGQRVVKVHRLVAEAFIPNPNNLPEINHKDENKMNNCVENLEWCTSKYNCNYWTRGARISKSNIGKHSLCGEKNGMYGVHRHGKNHPFYGKHHTEETRQLLREQKLGKKLSEIARKNQSIGKLNYYQLHPCVYVNDGVHNKRIEKALLDIYLSNGYFRGRVKCKD